SASYVVVSTPKRTAARYALPPSLRYSATRVAWPTQIGSTPVASGSSVPVCPTRFWPISLRTRATTSCEVIPAGLLMMKMPSVALLPFCCGARWARSSIRRDRLTLGRWTPRPQPRQPERAAHDQQAPTDERRQRPLVCDIIGDAGQTKAEEWEED